MTTAQESITAMTLLARAEALLKKAPPITNEMYVDRDKKISFGKQAKALAKEIRTFRGAS